MDHKQNEFTLVKKLMIMLVMIELVFTFFVSTTGSNTISVGCIQQNSSNPACTVQNSEQGINSTTNSLFNSFDCVTNNAANPSCSIRTSSYNFTSGSSNGATGCLFNGCPINNFYYGTVAVGVGILNAVIGFVTMFAYGLILIGEIFGLVFLPVVIIPAIFNQADLGALGGIVQIVYTGITIIIIGYVGYIILNRIRGN